MAVEPADSLQHRPYAGLLEASTLGIGARQLVETLAAVAGFDRASLGLRMGDATRLIASSHLDSGQLSAEYGQLVLGAMEEALDQGISLSWPPLNPDLATVLLEHKLLGSCVNGVVASIPLGMQGQAVAVICVERHTGPPFTAAELHALEQHLYLVAPALNWMQQAGESWHRRAWRDLLGQAEKLRQPDKLVSRRLLAGAVAAVAFVMLFPAVDALGGRARIEGAEQRLIAAPTDGFVKTAHVRPGDVVKAGDALVDLIETDLRLEHDRWRNQLVQHENAYAAAMSRNDRVAAATSMARVGEAQAQLALIEGQLERGRITAPFDAQVIAGDLSQSIGAPVRQGDTLLTLATSGRQRIIVEIDEVDIGSVRPGQTGQLSLSSLPWSEDELVVTRIAPLARAVDGRNVFEVEARLVSPRDDLRPGLLGRAKVAVGRSPILWSWARQVYLRLRVTAWSWLG